MKANQKVVRKAGEERAVSAVIGVILMVAITVAISAVVYVYVQGLIPGMTATEVVPNVEFFKSSNRLTVQSCEPGIAWSSVNISYDGTRMQPLPGNVSAGQSIIGLSGYHVTVVYNNQLIGTYDFT